MKKIITLIILSLLVYSSHCRKKNGKKKDSLKSSVNICDEENRETSLTCFCSLADIGMATDATCWVYGLKITSDNPIWEHFESQTNLEKLKFNIRPDGNMPNVPTNALKYLKQLKWLEIQYSTIPELTPYVFANLSSLSDIVLSSNQIAHLRAHSFSFMENLTTINLDENRISEVKRGVFHDLPSLKMLYVNQNNLSILHEFAFEHLNRLEELEVNGNQISIITKETFFGLKSLRMLDLKKNRLTMLGDFTFLELPNLQELDVEQNRIEYISDKAFAGLTRLSRLRLSENNLRTLSSEVFKGSPNLFFLDLRSNGLEVLTYETLKPIWENLKNVTAYMHLHKNKLKCDCNLLWVRSLQNETKSIELRNSLEELICMTDEPEQENEGANSIKTATEKSSGEMLYTVDVNSVQYDGEDVDYEESAESDYEYTLLKPPRRHFFDIPIEKLPCPEMQQEVTEIADKSNLVHLESQSSGRKMKDNFYLLLATGIAWTFALSS